MTTAAHAREDASRPYLPADHRFALVQAPDCPLTKPVVFERLEALANALQRLRKVAPIQLLDAALPLRGEPRPRKGVSVWILGPDGERRSYLGWCWLSGGGREALQRAIVAAGEEVVA